MSDAPAPPGGLKDRLAWRRARKLVARRAPRPARAAVAERRVLAVLPDDEAGACAAWAYLADLGWPPAQVTVVLPAGETAVTPPGAYVGRLTVVTPKDRDLLGLPKRAVRETLWRDAPDVALYLRADFDLGLAALVGASPAALRAGLFTEAAGPLFDVAAAPGPGALAALRRVLDRLRPAVLP